ncbi:MAG: TIGR00159 family protein [Marinilabiliales bacterium]|jgi:uncharacterized protein (TIGR00159 family)|nr:MAG: TIGR00159 family protein [Marinilabiliales bacterium]
MLLFIEIRLFDFIDVFLVAVLLFGLYRMLKGTVAISIIIGLVGLFMFWKIIDALQMELLSQILGAFISVGLVALIIIFQPEIRQFLLALGRPRIINKYSKSFPFLNALFHERYEVDIDAIVTACRHMGNQNIGALIVMTRQNELYQFLGTGQVVDSRVSSSLLENIFFKNSPLHDGAVIITNNRIKAAAVILPITKQKVSKRAGLRHRAAIGITEVSDAIAIVVSEETGNISYCVDGEMYYNIDASVLQMRLNTDMGLKNIDKKS